MASSTTELLAWVDNAIPARLPISAAFTPSRVSAKPALRKSVASPARSASPSIDPAAVPLRYSVVAWSPPPAERITEAIYENYGLQSMRDEESRVRKEDYITCVHRGATTKK